MNEKPRVVDFDYGTRYKIIDRRNGKRVGIGTYGPLWYAHGQTVAWRKRDRRGLRRDIHDLIPFLAIAIEDRI